MNIYVLWTSTSDTRMAKAREFVVNSFWNWKSAQGLRKRRNSHRRLKTRRAALFWIIWSFPRWFFGSPARRELQWSRHGKTNEQMIFFFAIIITVILLPLSLCNICVYQCHRLVVILLLRGGYGILTCAMIYIWTIKY